MGETAITSSKHRTLIININIGVIKGSEEALMCPNKYLDLDAYLRTSTRKQRFAESQRAEVYSLFERYQKMRGNSWSYDGADRYVNAVREMVRNLIALSLEHTQSLRN